MKKLVLMLSIFLITGLSNTFAQNNFRYGANIGIPVGDADGYDLQVGADLAYMFEVRQGFGVGPMLGYTNFLSDSFSVSFMPVAVTGRYGLIEAFFVGADLGYGISLEDGLDGGFFYRPKVGYEFGSVVGLVSYSGISVKGGTFSSINLGVEFGL